MSRRRCSNGKESLFLLSDAESDFWGFFDGDRRPVRGMLGSAG